MGNTKFLKSDYTSNGQGIFSNEKLYPGLAQNQKDCKYATLALARKLKLLTCNSNCESGFTYYRHHHWQQEQFIYIPNKWIPGKKIIESKRFENSTIDKFLSLYEVNLGGIGINKINRGIALD